MNHNYSLGLAKDTPDINIPEGFYSFALNAIHDGVEGSQGFISNEHANQFVDNVSGEIKGTIPADSNNTVIFSGEGNIYMFDGSNVNLAVSLPELNFGFPITGQFKIVNGCERVVYFRDPDNRDRYFNFDKSERFDTVNEFNINPDISYPCVTSETVKGGGRTEWGSYTFVVELLDNDLNTIYKTIPTSPVYIAPGLNTIGVEGYKPLSTDSIKLVINNLDQEYAFIRIGVIKYTSSDGISKSSHYVGELIPVSGTTVTYYYRGFNVDNGDFLEDADKLLATNAIYEKSKVMESVQGRLVRANLTEQLVDYSLFQKAASKITTKYVVSNLVDTGDDLTEQGDEIKAYGIVYLFANGQTSPVFHIPGRRKLDTDSIIVQDLDGVDIEKWELYNTAIKDVTPIEGYDSSGLFGYYECDSVYTTPLNYCEEDYWGVDSEGYALVDTNVRHHRIPCRTLEPLTELVVPFANPLLRYIGTQFDNIEYPHPDIVGHFFVTNERDVFNSTVTGAGYMVPYNYEQSSTGSHKEGRYLHWMNDPNVRQDNSTEQNFISIPFFVDDTTPQGTHVKINGYNESEFTAYNLASLITFVNFNENLPYDELVLYGKIHEVQNFTAQEELIKLERSLFLPYRSETFSIPNNSLSSNFNVLELESEPTTFDVDRTNLNYTYVKQDIKVHCNLYSIRYRVINTCPLTSLDATVLFGGDTFISPLSLTNISYFTIGDGNLLDPRDEARFEYEYIYNLYTESPHNFRHRLQGADICNQYYKTGLETDPSQSFDLAKYIVDRVTEPFDAATKKLRDSVCLEWYGYNKDYSVISNNRTFLNLSLSYNFCSACLNEYPTRIIWSETSTQESDNYRIFKPLNYIDLPANRGSITSLNYKNNNVYVRTQQSLYMLQPNPQKLQADGIDIYIGTGDFFGIPPIEIQTTDIGYGGQTSILGQTNCLHGLVWCDEDQGKILSVSTQMEEISKYKMYHWFEQNLPSNIKQYFKANNIEYNADRWGTVITYDPKFERLIVHKKDFKPLFSFFRHSYVDDIFYNKYGEALDYHNELLFENKSWTISYSFRTKTWISWHSYQPNLMFYNANTFFSIIDEEIWSHDNYYRFHNYFNQSFPYIIDFVDKNLQTYNLHAIHYYAVSKSYVDNQWIDNMNITFDKAMIYNNNQTTGLINLSFKDSPEDNLFWSNITKAVIERNKEYKIAQIRDIATSVPVNTSNWTIINSFYSNGQGYIDVLPNPANIDYNKELFELNEFRDKYVHVRLFFHDNERRITTYIMNTTQFETN